MNKPRISIIAAVDAKTRVMGINGELPWSLPRDLARFRGLTRGCPVIMGRKTWDSLPEKFRPLPNRENIIVTRQNGALYGPHGAIVCNSLEDALRVAGTLHGTEEIFVIGGAQIYRDAMPLADRLYITEVEHVPGLSGDTIFPRYMDVFPNIIEMHKAVEENGHRYWWSVRER